MRVQTDIDRWLAEGEALVAHQDYALALVPLNRVTRTGAPGAVSSAAWRLKSQALVSLRHLEQAFTAADHAVLDQPDSVQALQQRAHVLELLQRYPEAIIDYTRTVELNPDDPKTWCALGDARLRQGQNAEGLTAYERAVALDAHDGLAWYDKGLALERLQRQEEALAAYQQAMRFTSKAVHGFAMSCVRAATLLVQAQQLNEAFACATQARQSEPALPSDRAQAWGIGGDILLAQKRFGEALAQYDEALTLEPTQAGWWWGKGKALQMLEHLDEAIASYDEALRLDPTREDARRDRLFALARRLLTEPTTLALGLTDPDAPDYTAVNERTVWSAEARYFARRRRYPEVEAALNQLLRLSRDAPLFRLLKAIVQALQRQYRSAWMTLTTARGRQGQ